MASIWFFNICLSLSEYTICKRKRNCFTNFLWYIAWHMNYFKSVNGSMHSVMLHRSKYLLRIDFSFSVPNSFRSSLFCSLPGASAIGNEVWNTRSLPTHSDACNITKFIIYCIKVNLVPQTVLNISTVKQQLFLFPKIIYNQKGPM